MSEAWPSTPRPPTHGLWPASRDQPSIRGGRKASGAIARMVDLVMEGDNGPVGQMALPRRGEMRAVVTAWACCRACFGWNMAACGDLQPF